MLLPKGVEEAQFKRTESGWIFSAPNPWTFGWRRSYRVDDVHKAALALCVRRGRYFRLSAICCSDSRKSGARIWRVAAGPRLAGSEPAHITAGSEHLRASHERCETAALWQPGDADLRATDSWRAHRPGGRFGGCTSGCDTAAVGCCRCSGRGCCTPAAYRRYGGACDLTDAGGSRSAHIGHS